jgi:hypothetical protein
MKFDLRENFLVWTALFLWPVFSIKAAYRVLRNFASGPNDGERAYSATQVPSGSELYGVASEEATATDGTIFKINIAILAVEWLDSGLKPYEACN